MVKSTRYCNINTHTHTKNNSSLHHFEAIARTYFWKCLAECGYSICGGDRKMTKNELRSDSPQITIQRMA